MKYCDQRVCMSVCLFVCLSVCWLVCPLAYLKKPHVQISPNFQYILPVAVARSSFDDSAIHYVLPVLWMTSCFHMIALMGRIRDDAYVSSSSPGGGTVGEVCHLRLHLVSCVSTSS